MVESTLRKKDTKQYLDGQGYTCELHQVSKVNSHLGRKTNKFEMIRDNNKCVKCTCPLGPCLVNI
jgi:hypothetical protein